MLPKFSGNSTGNYGQLANHKGPVLKIDIKKADVKGMTKFYNNILQSKDQNAGV